MSIRAFITFVGAALLFAGVFLGFSDVHVGSNSCGSALSPDSTEAQLGMVEECEKAIGSRPAFAWVLLGGGAILLLGGVLVQPRLEAR